MLTWSYRTSNGILDIPIEILISLEQVKESDMYIYALAVGYNPDGTIRGGGMVVTPERFLLNELKTYPHYKANDNRRLTMIN